MKRGRSNPDETKTAPSQELIGARPERPENHGVSALPPEACLGPVPAGLVYSRCL